MTVRSRRPLMATMVPVALAIVLTASACHMGGDASPTSTSSTPPPFPYAPFEIRTDVAVPLDPPLRDAATFAADATAEARLSNDPDKPGLLRDYRSKIAPEADTHMPPSPNPYVGTTGGALHRAVAAVGLPDGDVEVSVCLFDTPGLYGMEDDGTLVQPGPPGGDVILWRPRVQWTDRPAADGSTPPGPRWLLVDDGALTDVTEEQSAATCDPFKPEPFVQQPPTPTSAIPTPTP